MKPYNESQKTAIENACRGRITLIQGPPGTGKTQVLAAIAANMCISHPNDKILVITSMNMTADLVAEAIYGIKEMREKVCRVYGTLREDVFNVSLENMPEWSLLYKMFYDTKFLDSYTKELKDIPTDNLWNLPIEEVEQLAKFQIEYFFGQNNYKKDKHL